MTDEPTYDPAEVRLVEKLIEEFGKDAALAPGTEIVWKDTGEPVAVRGACEVSISQDGRLWVRYQHAGTSHVGVRENGETVWLYKAPLASPEFN